MTARKRLLQIASAGCVCYLPMWEGAGARAEDVSLSGNDGTLNIAASWVAGELRNGVRVGTLLGVADALLVPYSASLGALQTSTSLTFCLWVKPTTNETDLIGFNGYNPYWGYTLHINGGSGGTLQMRCQDGAGNWQYLTSALAPVLNAWNFVAFTFDGANFRFTLGLSHESVAGVQAGSQTSSLNVGIVGWDVTQTDVDEVRIWNRVLSDTELELDYYRTCSGIY